MSHPPLLYQRYRIKLACRIPVLTPFSKIIEFLWPNMSSYLTTSHPIRVLKLMCWSVDLSTRSEADLRALSDRIFGKPFQLHQTLRISYTAPPFVLSFEGLSPQPTTCRNGKKHRASNRTSPSDHLSGHRVPLYSPCPKFLAGNHVNPTAPSNL
jgi:hypothetical protein